ncbi:hypothetical protein JTE90_008918 [Oedothorax gibbosus]|uniref:Uncharacterized protein n=1 Tax=Oedothorax gibbosus TaxID=931172 RepID=A0AAV6TR41_9ARAC|nr:hypothetical protein JTE90_008918 [Oedothorax gibbosus]
MTKGKRDARNIGVPLHSPQEGPAIPPSSHCYAFVSPSTYSSSPATSSLVLPYNNPFYAYDPYGPAHHHPQLFEQPLIHHHHHPATPLFWHPSTPSGSPAGGVVTPDAVSYGGGGASNSIPASNNSGEESRGSQPFPGDYKGDSGDKGQSPHASHKDLVTYDPKVHAAAMAAMRNHSSLATSLENHRRYLSTYELNYHQDRRETAANA